ncbi:hypothetical protein ACHAPE_001079 [Trichoderma viride]
MPRAVKRSGSTLRRSPKRHQSEALMLVKQEQEEFTPSLHNENAQEEEETEEEQILHTVKREDAQQLLRCIIEPLREGNMPIASLASLVTLPLLTVLPPDDKARIMVWAEFKQLKEVTQWQIGISEDVQEFHWYEARYDNPTEPEWKGIEKYLLENPTCPMIGDLRRFKEAMRYQADQLFQKDFLLDVLMHKLEQMPATQETTNVQLRKDIQVLREAVNRSCGFTRQMRPI